MLISVPPAPHRDPPTTRAERLTCSSSNLTCCHFKLSCKLQCCHLGVTSCSLTIRLVLFSETLTFALFVCWFSSYFFSEQLSSGLVQILCCWSMFFYSWHFRHVLSSSFVQGLGLLLVVKRGRENKLDLSRTLEPVQSIGFYVLEQLSCNGNCVIATVMSFDASSRD